MFGESLEGCYDQGRPAVDKEVGFLFHVSDTAALTLWWYPSSTETFVKAEPEYYMLRRLFLWIPQRAQAVNFKIVVALKDSYYLATEELGCKVCGRNFQCLN